MTQITASMVKELREKTGAGMMDAKNALTENNGDMDAAIDWLRAKGLAKAAKKSARTAAEGLVAVTTSATGKSGAIVEINSETDFVARNEQFQTFTKTVVNLALTAENTLEALSGTEMEGKTIAEKLTDLIAKIGENMTLRRYESLDVEDGVVATYVHNAVAENLGKIGVLVALESEGDQEKLETLGKQIAMHIAAANPQALDPSTVDASDLERERAVLLEQAKESGKPADIAEKMVEGRIRKYYEEVCLTEQTFIMDGENKDSQVIENAAKEMGSPIKLTGYIRFALGEGIEKEEEDFAAEVAKTARSA